MGTYKFRLSDILPNAWFYKLKDMSKHRKNQSSKHPNKKKQPPPPPTFSSSAKITPPSTPRKLRQVRQVTQNQSHQSRKSYYFTRELNNGENGPLCNSPIKANSPRDPPRKSSRQKPRKSTRTTTTANKASSVSVSVSVSAGCRTSVESVWTKSDSPPDQLWSSSSLDSSDLEYHHLHNHETLDFRGDSVLPTETTFEGMISMSSSNEKDIITDVKNLELPRIITKPEDFTAETKNESTEQPMKTRKGSSHGLSSVRRVSSSSTLPGIKLQTKSPRIANRKINQAQSGRRSVSSSTKRGSLSESFAIVKKSFDPQKDFRDSMVEMIMENNIKESKDLEDLLTCYLSLNADEYHELIIDVFKQIWFDLN